jgi:rhodanese-related sulfurtransferase
MCNFFAGDVRQIGGGSAQDSQSMITYLFSKEHAMTATISREELQDKIDRQEPLVLVEALAELQYQQGHLPGAVNLPAEKVAEHAAEVIPEQDAEVVVYCASESCHAAEKVAKELEQQGYSQVRHYVGGKQNWLDAGLPLEGDPQTAKTSGRDTTATSPKRPPK